MTNLGPIDQAERTDTTPLEAHPSLRGGVKTSEFWLTVLTLVMFVVGTVVPDEWAHKWAQEHGWVGGLVVAVYLAVRGYIKATALKRVF